MTDRDHRRLGAGQSCASGESTGKRSWHSIWQGESYALHWNMHQFSVWTPFSSSEQTKPHFSAPFSKLCQIWLHHWLQSLSPHRCPPMLSAPSERFRYYSTNKTENYMALKHECKHEAHLPQVKTRKRREFCLDWDNFGFIYAGVSSAGSYKSNARMCCENWCLFCLMKISILVLLLCVFIFFFQNTGNKRAQKSNFSSL